MNKQGKDKLLIKYHRDVIESVEKAIFSCEMLSIMLEYRKPELSTSFANSLDELITIRDCLAEMKKGL